MVRSAEVAGGHFPYGDSELTIGEDACSSSGAAVCAWARTRSHPGERSSARGAHGSPPPSSSGIRPSVGSSLSTLYGPPGVGKSALAVHLAHSLIDYSPDVQPWVEFGPRIETLDALEMLLQALGAEGLSRPLSTLEPRRTEVV